MCCHDIDQSIDQPGKDANPARAQLNRENERFPVPVHALEIHLARRVRPFGPAPAYYSFSALRLNLMLTHGIPPDFRVGVHLSIITPHIIGCHSRAYRVITQLRTDDDVYYWIRKRRQEVWVKMVAHGRWAEVHERVEEIRGRRG